MKCKLLLMALLASLSIAGISPVWADEGGREFRHGGHRAERDYYEGYYGPRYHSYYSPVMRRPYYNPGYAYPPGVNITLPLPPLPIYIDPVRIFGGRR
jgi:hypothetical protein